MPDPVQYNPCQYWYEEPSVCKYWHDDIHVCSYYEDNGFEEADLCARTRITYPFCNNIGTNIKCQAYKAAGSTKYRCILPDPTRHVHNVKTCKSWVVPLSEPIFDAKGFIKTIPTFTFSDITKYNNGDCDNKGTSIECAGYMPYILGFGIVKPSEDVDVKTRKATNFPEEEYCLIAEELGYRLPLDYEILNERARLSKCAWWKGDVAMYAPGTDGKIAYFNTKCDCKQLGVVNFRDGGVVGGRFYYKCNGASSDCSNYTGVCWQYCTDLKMKPGDKVKAEQIHELRYYIRKERWTKGLYELYFSDAYIYAWDGWDSDKTSILIDSNGNQEYRMGVTKVYIENFDPFTIGYEKTTITAGLKAGNQGPNYPSLISNLKHVLLAPIIRNTFEQENGRNYYETTTLMEDKEFIIYGESFYLSNTFVLNGSDPEIKNILSSYLYQYDSMLDIELGLNNPVKFAQLKEDLNTLLSGLTIIAPEKLRCNLTDPGGNTFAVNINTYYNENIIFAFSKGQGTWEYDKITFNKYFVGGMVVQTNFAINGDGGAVVGLPYYEKTFACDKNDNGDIQFEFVPISHGGFTPTVSYVFNDYDFHLLTNIDPCGGQPGADVVATDDANILDSHLTGYILYLKITEVYTLSPTEYKVLPDGYIVLTLDNLEVSNAVLPWIADEYIIYYQDGSFCPLEVILHSYYGQLSPNEVILYPKDINKYKTPCDGKDNVVLGNLTIFQKRSFGENPGDGWQAATHYDNQSVLNKPFISGNNPYILTQFVATTIAGVTFKGRSGRDVGSTRTKMVTWVKQPFCPDVEMRYTWAAEYKDYACLPTCRCHGTWSEVPIQTGEYASTVLRMEGFGTTIVNGRHRETRDPQCGDHNLLSTVTWKSAYTHDSKTIGALWWPYTFCKGYQSYELVTNQDYSAMEVMDVFTEGTDMGNYVDYKHGQHDLRYLGPDMYMGWTGDFCHIPTACDCGKDKFNAVKVTPKDSNIFMGYGQIRSGISDTQLLKWEKELELWPEFGNPSRPFARSYRAMDRVQYYETRPQKCITRAWKWLPIPMAFGDVDITKEGEETFWAYDSGVGQNTINPMSYMLAETIDGISVNESISQGRYRFDDVFRVRADEQITYPQGYGYMFRDSIPWYEFKSMGAGQSIQWAWRDYWKPLERRVLISLDSLFLASSEDDTKKPYTREGGNLVGLHLFCSVSYPSYVHDMYLREYTRTIDEGRHELKFVAPNRGVDGKYIGLPGMQLDDGPVRYFDWSGGDAHKKAPNYSLYDTCTKHPWYGGVSLFDNGSDAISDANSVKQNRQEDNPSVYDYKYFKTGLKVEVFASGFPFFPKILEEVVEFDAYITAGSSFFDSAWPPLVDQSPQGGAASTYTSSADFLYFTFTFGKKVKTISRVVLEFKYGYQEEEPLLDANGNVLRDADGNIRMKPAVLYHVPAVGVYAPEASSGYSSDEPYFGEYYSLYNSLSMDSPSVPVVGKPAPVVLKKVRVDCIVPLAYLITGGRDRVLIKLSQLAFGGSYLDYNNSIEITGLKLHEEWAASATEYINTYERMYHISVGNHGDMAPQGDDSNALLSANPLELSTIWQRDSRLGVMECSNNKPEIVKKVFDRNKGILASSDEAMSFVNKCQGRYVQKIQPELEPLKGSPIQMEKKQKELFDAAVKPLKDDMSMSIILPPTLGEFLADNRMKMSLPSTCSFKNTYVAPLSELVEQSPYSPAGHKFVQGAYMKTWCGDRSFSYEYIQMEKVFGDTINTTGYGEAMYGVGTVYVDPKKRIKFGGYMKHFNEVTQYSLGSSLLMDRLDIMSTLIFAIYPKYFARATTSKAFASPLSRLVYPTTLKKYPFQYFPNDEIGYAVDADIARDDFNKYGGWEGKYWANNPKMKELQQMLSSLDEALSGY
jgi:hypothetical protein